LQLPHKARVLRRATLQHANTPVDVLQSTSTSISPSLRTATFTVRCQNCCVDH